MRKRSTMKFKRLGLIALIFAALILNLPVFAANPKPGKGPVSNRPERTRSEVMKLIQAAGPTNPDWWDSVPLEYPKTLDLTWKQPPKGSPWNTNKNIGQYLWSIINENPGRWKKGAKFMHHVAEVNKKNPDALKKAWNALGHIYADLLQDYARGAYWWQKGGSKNIVGLADCYWRLGNKQMAVKLLSKISFDGNRVGNAIRLWSDMGEWKKALKLAESSGRRGNPAGAYLSAGNVCRVYGNYKKALEYYNKVLAVKAQGKRDWKWQKNLATAAIAAIKIFETLDITKVPDGTYTGTSLSFGGDLTVSVTVAKGRITDIRVTGHKDKQFFSALTETPKLIIEHQSLRNIDATTGATVTSDAIVNATAQALSGTM